VPLHDGRIFVAESISFARDPKVVVFVGRVQQLQSGWRFIKMLTMRGKDSGASMLVRFTFEDVE